MCTIRATRWTPSSLSGSCSRFDISMADGISLAPPSSSTIGLVLFGYWPFFGGGGLFVAGLVRVRVRVRVRVTIRCQDIHPITYKHHIGVHTLNNYTVNFA